MKLEMEAPHFPPSFLFPSYLSLSFPWGLGSTQDNAQSWDANSWAELQGSSQVVVVVGGARLELSPGRWAGNPSLLEASRARMRP